MKLDVDTLGTFYEMAREGAGLAAARLGSMTAIPARVGVTHLNFTRESTIRRELGRPDRVGISVDLSDGFAGTSVLLFDAASAETITGAVSDDVPADGELHESAVTEVGQIMNNGFVDGWANVLDANIDVSAPAYVATDDGGGVLDEPGLDDDELAVVFRNNVEAVGEELSFWHYLLPERETIARLFGARTDDRAIEFEKLAGFDRIARRGASRVAADLAQMSGLETTVDLRRINFVSLDAIPNQVSAGPKVGVAFAFSGMPGGYLLLLFDEESARTLVGTTLARDPAPGLDAFERDAIQELSNVMASGMLDGWANLLDTTIDHSTPAFAHDMGAAVVDSLVVGLGDDQEFAFVFDTRIEAVDTAVDLDVYVIPDEADLREALGAVEVDRVDGVRPDASATLPGDHADLGGRERP